MTWRAFVALTALGFATVSCSGERPDNIGVASGTLTPCPDTPNCVSSDEARSTHRVQPFSFAGDPDSSWSALVEMVQNQRGTRVVHETDHYLHVEFEVFPFGFVDDVEFHLRRETGLIAVRSASRLGKSDLGVNRRRVERLRSKWNKINRPPRESQGDSP